MIVKIVYEDGRSASENTCDDVNKDEDDAEEEDDDTERAQRT